LAEAERNLPAQQEAWERKIAGQPNVWVTLDLTNAIPPAAPPLRTCLINQCSPPASNPTYDTYQIDGRDRPEKYHGDHAGSVARSEPSQERSRALGSDRQFYFGELGMMAASKSGAGVPPSTVFFGKATADWEQQYYRAEHAVDRQSENRLGDRTKFGQRHFLIAELKDAGAF